MLNDTLRDAQKFMGCRVSPISLLLSQLRTEARWHSHACMCSLTQLALGLLRLPVPTAQEASTKKTRHSSALWIKNFENLMGKGANTSPLQQGAPKLKFGFPAAPTTPSSSAGHPQPPGLPYSCISWLFGKPKVLQNDLIPSLLPLPTIKQLQSIWTETHFQHITLHHHIFLPFLPVLPHHKIIIRCAAMSLQNNK